MLNGQELPQNISLSLVYILLTLAALTPIALADSLDPDIYDLWNTVEEFETTYSLRKFLIEKDWINEEVTIDELDYILVLTQQCSKEFFPNVPTSLALAVISVESGFKSDLTGLNDDTGLMQIIPKYHRDRIESYIYDENVDLYDSRLNVMVGMDYLNELLMWSKGDLELALMGYNMGQVKARSLYLKGKTTSYSQHVTHRMNEIESFLERRR